MADSKIVTAVGISVNGHLPVHADRLRRAMEAEVLTHQAEHGEILEKHAPTLQAKMAAARQRESDAIVSGD